MSSIIESLWNGNICMCDHCGVHDPQVKQTLAQMERNCSALSAQITPGQQAIFEEYMDCAEDYLLLLTEHAFRDGFSLAVKLLTEAMEME